MTITNTQLVISVSFALLMGGLLAYLFWRKRKEAEKQLNGLKKEESSPKALELQLQAYERLILLTDRIALPNLITRIQQPSASLKEMQALLTQQIQQEFNYNITQQIYVSPEAWEAVRNLKDQNLLIVHQVANFLPANASGADLNRAILEMLLQNPKSSLHQIVSDVLSFEAKKRMQ
jgi:hypothetical protein